LRVFGLIGFPLSHSFSKRFFAEKFLREGIADTVYENFPLTDISLFPDLLKANKALCGLNVTIPYKQDVIPFLDDYNEVVKGTGACNCIRIEAGETFGFNTDVAGFQQSLTPKLAPHHTRALILGRGGAARAVAYALTSMGIGFRYVVRKRLADDDALLYQELTSAIIKAHPLIINTTPIGMYPDIDAFPAIPYEFISSRHYLYDLIYNPEKTAFLEKGEKQGAAIQNGMPMLIIQAEESWKIWNS